MHSGASRAWSMAAPCIPPPKAMPPWQTPRFRPPADSLAFRPSPATRTRIKDMPGPWSLHPQLARDTAAIGDLALSRVLVANDANWPRLLLVPRREGACEIIDLDDVEQVQLMAEIARVARALKEVTACDKLNVAALGNVVPQLQVHVIALREGDAGWPKPIWGAAPPISHEPQTLERFIAAIRGKLWVAEGS